MNSFLQGKKVLTVAPLRPLAPSMRASHVGGTTAPAPAAEPCKTPGGAQPTVEVIKEGDKVVRLIVVCSCGERVEIECLYPGAG